jgi:peptidyl-prolyl cis-trans isomerase D
MLDALRQGAQGWVSKLLMGLLVISFGIWGVSGQFAGYGAGTLATVGDVEVSVPDFARRYQQVQRLSQQSGREVSPEQVLDQMILNAALTDEAQGYNLGVSDAHVARVIAEDASFRGPNGFDRAIFQAILQNSGIDRDDYVRDIRDSLVREQIATSLNAGVDVPQPLVEALYRFQNEERTISFVDVDATAIEPVGTPDASTLQAYFDENLQRFRAPEYRKLGILTLNPAAAADPAAVTEEAIAAEYETRKASLTRPERRRIEQLRLPTREAAEAALQKIQGGAEFAAVAQESQVARENLDQGLKTRAEFLDPAVAEAAFAAELNVVVPVLEGALEPSLIRVTEIEPGAVTPLAEIAPRLRQDLAARTAREEIRSLYDQIEDERAGGATLAEIAAKLELPYRVVEGVAQDGTAPDGSPVADLPAGGQLVKEAFESDVGVENNPLRAGDDTNVFYDVLEVTPERDRTLDEAREEVMKEWQAEEIASRVGEKANALLARLQQGEPLEKLAAEIGKPVQVVEKVKRGAPPPGLSANAAEQAFAGPEGHVANAEADAPPGRILLKVDKVIVPAYFAEAADAQAIRQQLAAALRNDLLQTYNRQVLQSRETRVNNAALAQLTSTVPTQ